MMKDNKLISFIFVGLFIVSCITITKVVDSQDVNISDSNENRDDLDVELFTFDKGKNDTIETDTLNDKN